MTTTTHTPGPWVALIPSALYPSTSKSITVYLDDGDDGGPFAEVHGRDRAANARLIAAAPDLLEAAQHALEDLEHLESGKCDIDHVAGVLIELRTAIRKAGGEG